MKYLLLFLFVGIANAAPMKITSTLTLNNATDVVISDKEFTSTSGPCLILNEPIRVTVVNVKFNGCDGAAIQVSKPVNLTIDNNYFTNVKGGIYVWSNDTPIVNGLRITNNRLKNIKYQVPPLNNSPRGQFIQLDGVQGTGIFIDGNNVLNEEGFSTPEDIINFNHSGGTNESPLQVTNNCIKGGGPSKSGGGIITDGGTSTLFPNRIVIRNNKLIEPGQYGIGVAVGTNIDIQENVITSKIKPWNNVGVYMYNQYAGQCDNISFIRNTIYYVRSNNTNNHWYHNANCTNVVKTPNTLLYAEPVPYPDCPAILDK